VTNETASEVPDESARKAQKTIIDELEFIQDENEKFWKTPSSTRIVRGGTLMLALDIFGSLFFTVYMMQLSRAPTEDSAMLAIIDTLSIMLRFFAYLGFTGAGSKFMSEYLVRDKDTARIYGMASSKYNFLLTGFPLIAVSLVLLITQPKNDIEFIAYLTLVVIMIFDRLTSCVNIYILGYQRYDIFAYAVYLPYAGMYLTAMITYPLMGVIGPLLSFAIWRVLTFLFCLIGFKKCSDFPLRDVFTWGQHFGLFKKLFTFNFLYSMANLAFSLLTTTLLISGGQLLGVLSPYEIVALYTISTFSNILMNLFGIVAPIMVSISEAHSLKNRKLTENYTMLCLKFPIVMTVAVLTFFFLFRAEMIEIFYGARWITMGTLIMVCLMPSYVAGSFASRYDNILAGIGRPETVIVPWMLAVIIGFGGLLIGRFLPNLFLVDDIILTLNRSTGLYEPVNYGITLKFFFTLGLNSIALFIAGIWIVKICLKVLDVKIPGHYLWKPILVAGLTAVIVELFLYLVPLRQILTNFSGDILTLFSSVIDPSNVDLDTVGGILFTIIMVLGGVIVFLTLGILFDVMNREDGLFWRHIVSGMGPFYPLMKPIFWYAKFLLKYQIPWTKSPPMPWVMKTDKAILEKESQFHVHVVPKTKIAGRSEKGVELVPGQEVEFAITFDQVLQDLKDVIVYARIDFDKLPNSLVYAPEIPRGVTTTLSMKFTLPSDLRPGSHELLVNIEAYNVARPEISPEMSFRKGWWAYWDFRMRWLHEEEYFVHIPK
jgi:O-antigen/teichoic acid export membrane protein